MKCEIIFKALFYYSFILICCEDTNYRGTETFICHFLKSSGLFRDPLHIIAKGGYVNSANDMVKNKHFLLSAVLTTELI